MVAKALSTATTIAGYGLGLCPETGMTKLSFAYDGWFPVLELDAERGSRRGFVVSTMIPDSRKLPGIPGMKPLSVAG
jgi:hypothetical protein